MPNITVKTPPHSTDAEISVLGALLLDKNAIVNIAEFLHAEHFYDNRHASIFEAMVELYEGREPIDVLTVADRLRRKKRLKEIGGSTYLAELVNQVPTAAHVEHYGKIVRDAATKRSLMQAAAKLVELCLDDGMQTADLLDRAESEVFSLTQKTIDKAFTPVRATLTESFDRLDELHKTQGGHRGVATGVFPTLDNATAGFQKSNLIILAARPGVGKTAFALNCAQSIAIKQGKSVGMFSLEMSKEELVDRLLVNQADVDAWRLKTGKLTSDDWDRLSDAMGVLADAPIYIDDTPGLSILEMRTKARRLQVEHGLDLLIVDYLQLAQGRTKDNRVTEVGEISQGLKNLARELKIPVIALAQLSRSVEQRGTKKPQLSDLRESGSIEQDADIVMFLWREDDEDLETMQLDIAKHRNGGLHSIPLYFKGDRIKFLERNTRHKDAA
jgi:replicative DNA helicase